MGAWYKDWYLTTKEGEEKLREALADPDNGAQNRADVNQRLGELVRIPEQRCASSSEQRRFLQRVLAAT